MKTHRLDALDISLSSDELRRIESTVPADRVPGNRYYDAGMVNIASGRDGRIMSA